jgi:predicted RNA-binding protein YlqC (UPF0109 family)
LATFFRPVDKPDQVRVTVIEGEKITVIELRVAPGNVGKVISKHGRTKLRKWAVLDILE